MIRPALPTDLPTITAIYNDAILEGGFTGDLTAVSLASRQTWLAEHQDNYGVFVVEPAGEVMGYVSVSPYRKGRQAFATTCEVSYYVARGSRGQGLGKALLHHGLAHAQNAGFAVAVAILLGGNARSIALLQRFGFAESGRIQHAACIFGQYIDHVYMSRLLTRPAPATSSVLQV